MLKNEITASNSELNQKLILETKISEHQFNGKLEIVII